MKYKRFTSIINYFIIIAYIFLIHTASVNAQIFQTTNAKEKIGTLNEKIKGKKKEIEALENEIKRHSAEIEKKRSESISLKNQLNILNNQVAKTELDIESIRKQAESAELEIEAAELEINFLNSKINSQKKLIASIVRKIHSEDSKNYLTILIKQNSFSSFFDDLENMKSLQMELNRMLEALQINKNQEESKKLLLAQTQKQLDEMQIKLEAELAEMSEISFLKNNLLEKTKSSEARFKMQLNELTKQYNAIENEIRSIESAIDGRLSESGVFTEEGELIAAWPVPSKYITTIFHDPEYPYRHIFEHNGIDIRAPHGTPVRAVAPGYIARAKKCSSSSCYSYILIAHGKGIATVYGHLSGIAVQDDQYVTRGQIIGYSGGTPGSIGAGPFVTGPHLHFEVRVNGIPIDPVRFLLL